MGESAAARPPERASPRAGAAQGADDSRLTVAQLGEEAVLARLIPLLPASTAAHVGIGDDAAVVAAADGRFVVTTDLMVHGPDFRAAWSTPYDLGWKAAATNLADVAAMGAVPTALVVAVALPSDTPVAAVEGFARGLADACRSLAPGCGVVGGDLSTSPTQTISVTAMGDLEGRSPVLRSGARSGDVIAYSGALGLAAAGLALLFEEGLDAAGKADRHLAEALWRAHPDLVAAQLRPSPPIGDGVLAALAGAHAMLDVSDGLAMDARRMARASGVRVVLDPAALGEHPDLVLSGGEDHGLLAAFPATAPLPGAFRVIGRVAPRESGPALWIGETPYREAGGWDPYRDAGGGTAARPSHHTTVSP
jgi:thiamine-monophosphate kinase